MNDFDDLDAIPAEHVVGRLRALLVMVEEEERVRHALFGRLAAGMRQASSMEPRWNARDWWLRTERYRKQQPELVRRNRRAMAERLRWPDGALAMCEHLDAEHPGWTAWWRPDNTIPGWFHPAGFTAWRESSGRVCGTDPVRLYQAMQQAPDERHWHYHGLCCELTPASEEADRRLIAAALADTGR